SSVEQATTPPTASPCPPRYFVALWKERAAPCSSGLCSTGVANVLSTATGTSPTWSTTAAISTSSRDGLAGVSSSTNPDFGVIASATAPASQNVTSVPSSPEASK